MAKEKKVMSELPNDGIFSTKSSRAVLTIYSIIFHNKQRDEIVLVSALLSSCFFPGPRRIKKVQNRTRATLFGSKNVFR